MVPATDGMVGLPGLLFVMEDDDRERRIYGRGGGLAGSITGEDGCEDEDSTLASGSYSSVSARGGGRSTIASKSYKQMS